MWPGKLQDRLVFFRIKGVACRVYWGRNGAEEIDSKLNIKEVSFLKRGSACRTTDHLDDLGIYAFSNDTALRGNVLQQIVKGLGLDLLSFEIGTCIIEVEDRIALLKFLDEKSRTFGWWSFCTKV